MAGFSPATSTRGHLRPAHGRRSPPLLLEGLVESRSKPISSQDTTRWLKPEFPYQTYLGSPSINQLFLPRSGEEYAYSRSSRLYAPQGSYSFCQGSEFSGFLQSVFSCSEENRQLETSHRLIYAQSLHSDPNLQDGNGRIYTGASSTRSLGHFDRPFRCVFPYSYGYLDPLIPALSGSGTSLPVCSTPVWSSHGPKGFLQGGQGIETNIVSVGNNAFPISGRLAQSDRVSGVLSLKDSASSQTNPDFGLVSEFGEIRTCSHSNFSVPGVHVRSPSRDMLFTREKVSFSTGTTFPSVHISSHFPKVTYGSLGSHGLYGEVSSVRSTSHETDPSGTKATVAVPEYFNSRSENCSLFGTYSSPAMVVPAPKCYGDSATTPSSSIHIHLYGCLSGGMGCSHGSVHCPRVMVTRGQQTTLQSEGAQGSLSWTESSYSQIPRASGNSGDVGQHHSSLVYQQTRRDQMSSTCSVNMENFCLLSGQESPHSSQSHCRLFECACRHLVTKEPDSAHRMGFKSRGVQTAVQAVVHSSHRSLCNSLQQTTPIVCVANGRSPGIRSGCLSGRLESEVPLCLPSSQYCSKSGRQSTSISKSRDAPCRTLLENKGTLPSASAPQRETAGTIASDPQTLEATAPSRISQKPQSSQSSCLLAEESLKSQGFSVEVVERVLNPVRKSSQAVYEAKWNCFVSYCQDLDIDHTSISIPQLADYF